MTLIILFPIIILIFSYIYDIFLGEPPLKIHPVVILGKIIDFTSIYFRKISQKRIAGLLFLLFIIILYVIPSAILFLIFRLNNPYAILIYLLISIYILKSTFSVKSMHDHILKIIHALELNNIDMARRSTSLVVRRSTENMTPGLISSAAIETIAEGFVDGYLTPIFFYSFTGLAGALACRAINTMDSMVAYKDKKNIKFGYFTALADTIINYIPARLSCIIFFISSMILGYKSKFRTGINSTDSVNAGFSINSMAGILNVRLEKVGEYIINESGREPNINDIKRALKIYYLSSLISLVFACIIIYILYLAGIVLII